MLTTNKYKKLLFAAILISLATVLQGAGEQSIDINEITKNNPFAQFTANQNQNQTPVGMTIVVKPDLIVETATLKFLDAKSVKTSIGNMSSQYGSMEPDSKGNTLIICDTNETVAKILEQIHKIDRKPDQIMIEVVILDVKLDNDTQIGVNWDMLTTKYDNKLGSSSSEIGTSFRQSLTTGRLSSNTTGTDLAGIGTAVPATTSSLVLPWSTTGVGSDFSLIYGNIRNVIHVLQTKNNVEILASPRVMVVSGQTASIAAVEEIPYQEVSDTSNGGQLTNTQFKNVGVTLKVGATLTDDKFILLNVETEQSSRTGTLSGVPTVDSRKIQSSLLLNDSQILVIGGLRRKETQKQTSQLPILGDLPIVGYAFKSTETTQNSSELLILLSPHINGGKPSEAQMEKFNEITQRPLLTIPETEERKKEEQKKEAERIEKAEKERKAQETKEVKKSLIAKKQKSK
jgi:type II secretory pathway component GspD/PulD (secretin)